jgi:hypothetical protein
MVMAQQAKRGSLLHFVIEINHLQPKPKLFNDIDICLKFNQTSHMPVTGMVEGLVLAQDPNVADKMAVLEKAAEDQLDNPMLQAALGYAYGATGQRGKAQAKQAQLLHWAETSRKRRGYPLALISLGLGEDHDAVSWLETAHTEGCLWTLGFGSDPMLRSLNGHPRFESLLRRIGVPTRCHANSELSCYESPRTA